MEENQLDVEGAEKLGAALVHYLMHRFKGYDLGDGYALGGIQYVSPKYSRAGSATLPRYCRALKGWRRVAPPRSRVGVTVCVVPANAARLTASGSADMIAW